MPKKVGTCKLTGKQGVFVKSHLIPKALTRPEQPGMPFIQAGVDKKPITRWDSWYDDQLVIREGEDILRNYDTWAIATLRKHKLVWSGWNSDADIPDFVRIAGSSWGIRTLEGIDFKMLRLFLLSLLWRAAASRRIEFDHIRLPKPHMRRLRKMLTNKNPYPWHFYAAQLIQISTRGKIHNQSPLLMKKNLPYIHKSSKFVVPIARFYFDGLIVHFDCRGASQIKRFSFESLEIGALEKAMVTMIEYEHSFERKNIEANIRGVELA